MQLNPLALALTSAGMNRYGPDRLFLDGSQGFWLDASDRSTMFQDSAGTTPVTALGDPIGLWLDKSGRGNHFVQTTSGARPVWGSWPLSAAIAGRVRNLLSSTENFSSTFWSKTDTTITANAALSPFGTMTADLVTEGAAGTASITNDLNGAAVTAGESLTRFAIVKRGNTDWIQVGVFHVGSSSNFFRTFINTGSGALGTGSAGGNGAFLSHSVQGLGDEWLLVRVTGTLATATSAAVSIRTAAADGSASRVNDGTYYASGQQLERSATATAYQRVGVSSRYDVSEAGQPQVYFVSPNGVNDFMVSAANVDFSATDRMFVCAGVTKKSESPSPQNILDAASVTTNGRIAIAAPTGVAVNSVFVGVRGTAGAGLAAANTFISPSSKIITLLANISAPLLTQRVDGTQTASSTDTMGSGTFGNILRYIGAGAAGTANFSNANIYQLIAVGKTPTTSELNQTETFVAAKTKGSLA